VRALLPVSASQALRLGGSAAERAAS